MEDIFDIPTLPTGPYQHYKGNLYEVIGVACHSESQEYFVMYRPLSKHAGKPDLWVRPYAMFIENVTIDGKAQPRFKKLTESGQHENNSSDSSL